MCVTCCGLTEELRALSSLDFPPLQNGHANPRTELLGTNGLLKKDLFIFIESKVSEKEGETETENLPRAGSLPHRWPQKTGLGQGQLQWPGTSSMSST